MQAKASAEAGQLEHAHHQHIAEQRIDAAAEPGIGDAGQPREARGVDDGQPLADHRGREGRGQRVADLDKAAALVRDQQDRAVQGGAAAAGDLVADDLRRHMAGLAADERQVAAQQVREARARQGEAGQEEQRFDGAALSRFAGAVKYPIAGGGRLP